MPSDTSFILYNLLYCRYRAVSTDLTEAGVTAKLDSSVREQPGRFVAYMDTENRVTLLSYAKVNLTLEVSRLRPDGFHDIDSIAQIIGLTDQLVVERADDGVIEVVTERGDAPSGKDNTVHKACEVFFAATGIRGGARCILAKSIPAQAGLGGGSGNAAAGIAGLSRLYACDLSVNGMAAMAARVGSDAALFVHGGTIRMRGRGEQVEPLPDAPELHLVVVKPELGVSTAWAYGELDKSDRNRAECRSDAAERAIRSGDRAALIECLANDFDPVVTAAFPEIGRAKQLLRGAGAEAAMLCGSGSAVFGVFESAEAARLAGDGLKGEFAHIFVTRTLSRSESALAV